MRRNGEALKNGKPIRDGEGSRLADQGFRIHLLIEMLGYCVPVLFIIKHTRIVKVWLIY